MTNSHEPPPVRDWRLTVWRWGIPVEFVVQTRKLTAHIEKLARDPDVQDVWFKPCCHGTLDGDWTVTEGPVDVAA